MKKIKLVALFIFMFLGLGVIAGCGSSNIPTYQGMTISRVSKNTLAKYSNSVEPEINEEDLTENQISQDVEELEDLVLPTDEEVKYYVNKGEKFIVEIHLDNPKDYEIQSFTLNGKKYANYMFKDGSTMELLLLEVEAPMTSGYTEYTIDAIKYIDGTEIKDVRMDGDKTIKAGIKYDYEPTLNITNTTINATSINLDFNINDPHDIIGDNEVVAFLSNGQEVIEKKTIAKNDTSLTFDNLDMGATYQYGIFTYYDLIDGNELKERCMVKNTFKTLKSYNFKDLVIGKESVEFDFDVYGNEASINYIALFDKENNNELVESLNDLSIRSFNNLLSNHSYFIKVEFTYTTKNETKVQSDVVEFETLAKELPQVEFKNIETTKTSLAFDLNITDNDNVGSVKSIELYKDSELVESKTSLDDPCFIELLSNNEYEVKVIYSYDLNDGNGEQTLTATHIFKTISKELPQVEFKNIETEETSIKFDLNITDNDNVGYLSKVLLTKDSAIIKEITPEELANIKFENLGTYEYYDVKVIYAYDLNDGNGEQTLEVIKEINTNPHVSLKSCRILNNGAVQEGDSVFLEVEFNNPNKLVIDSIVVSGVIYEVDSMSSKVRIEIVITSEFEGGNTDFVIENVYASIDGKEYNYKFYDNNTDSIMIYGAFSVESVKFVDENLNEIEYSIDINSVYIYLTLSNDTGYNIDMVNNEDISLKEGYRKIDNNHYVYKYSDGNSVSPGRWNKYTLSNISYSLDNYSKSLIVSNVSNKIYLTKGVFEVKTPEDLMNVNGGYYYKLMNDIDLSGYTWVNINNKLNGVFDGNGYSIKNMGAIGNYSDVNLYLGLFKQVNGIVKNVRLENMVYIISLNNSSGEKNTIWCGGVFAANSLANTSIVENCSTDLDSYISITNHTEGIVYVGGLVGECRKENIALRGLENNASISVTANITEVGGVASLVTGEASVENCFNKCELIEVISHKYGHIGGVIGNVEEIEYLINCHNTSVIKVTHINLDNLVFVGGVFGYTRTYVKISDCTNTGDIFVKTNNDNGRIDGVGFVNSSGELINCTNTGNITKE